MFYFSTTHPPRISNIGKAWGCGMINASSIDFFYKTFTARRPLCLTKTSLQNSLPKV